MMAGRCGDKFPDDIGAFLAIGEICTVGTRTWGNNGCSCPNSVSGRLCHPHCILPAAIRHELRRSIIRWRSFSQPGTRGVYGESFGSVSLYLSDGVDGASHPEQAWRLCSEGMVYIPFFFLSAADPYKKRTSRRFLYLLPYSFLPCSIIDSILHSELDALALLCLCSSLFTRTC